MNIPELAAANLPIPQTPTHSGDTRRWCTVVTFAAAMAWVESAVVYYLRTMIDRLDPYQPDPLPIVGDLGPVELVREAATLIMLFTVGMLAGRTWPRRLGYTAVAFGTWDIFYYVFLKAMCGWPHSLLDWDILFLLPLPWWGPVLAPVAIALLMIVWGSLAAHYGELPNGTRSAAIAWVLNLLGMGLALYTFMADALRAAGGGVEVLRKVLPTRFDWTLFCIALLLMSVPALELAMRWSSSRNMLRSEAEG